MPKIIDYDFFLKNPACTTARRMVKRLIGRGFVLDIEDEATMLRLFHNETVPQWWVSNLVGVWANPDIQREFSRFVFDLIDEYGPTALVRAGRMDCAKVLVDGSDERPKNLYDHSSGLYDHLRIFAYNYRMWKELVDNPLEDEEGPQPLWDHIYENMESAVWDIVPKERHDDVARKILEIIRNNWDYYNNKPLEGEYVSGIPERRVRAMARLEEIQDVEQQKSVDDFIGPLVLAK